jgi:hypothetical protein
MCCCWDWTERTERTEVLIQVMSGAVGRVGVGVGWLSLDGGGGR